MVFSTAHTEYFLHLIMSGNLTGGW